MSKLDYWMHPRDCDTFKNDPKLTIEVLSHCIDHIKACELARKSLNDELAKLGFPGLDELLENLIKEQG
jgi:hypothetical protein